MEFYFTILKTSEAQKQMSKNINLFLISKKTNKFNKILMMLQVHQIHLSTFKMNSWNKTIMKEFSITLYILYFIFKQYKI